jgi:hypothetical protein
LTREVSAPRMRFEILDANATMTVLSRLEVSARRLRLGLEPGVASTPRP